MIKIALTGNIGSGKSTAVQIFSILGVPVFLADYEAKQLYAIETVKELVLKHFGEAVFNQQDEVDFKKLAQVVFNDSKSLQTINDIIHPLIFQKYQKWLETHHDALYTIHEAAIIFENNLEKNYDLIINVSAPEKIRMQRVMQRDGVTEEQFYSRARNQITDKEKNSKSDFVIINDGNQFLIPQVIDIHNNLKTL